MWTLEKSSGTLRVRNEISYSEGGKQSFYKSLNYTGSLINVTVGKNLVFDSISNFGLVSSPQGLPWSEIAEKTRDIFAVYYEETVGVPVSIGYTTSIMPFAGYSYLKLDYTKNYDFLSSGFRGHKVYHNYLFGLKETFYIKKWLKLSVKEIFSPFAYYYPMRGNRAVFYELGADTEFDFNEFGLHLYISSRKTTERSSEYYSKYISSVSDFGFTFRIGAK